MHDLNIRVVASSHLHYTPIVPHSALPLSPMNLDTDTPHRRIPTLVQLCQRVAATHVDSVLSLGDDLSYNLVKPILEKCSTDHLLRLEQDSPHLQKDTPEIWKYLCFQKYRLTATEQYSLNDDPQEPDSWRNRYFLLQAAEAKRLEEVGSKLRSQRLEADERKKEREVKFTDRVPSPKRPRTGWSTPTQPKTLFQKTRTEASKIQKAMYNARVIPPMHVGKTYSTLPKPPCSQPILPPPKQAARVIVHTVIRPAPPLFASTATTPAPHSSKPVVPDPHDLNLRRSTSNPVPSFAKRPLSHSTSNSTPASAKQPLSYSTSNSVQPPATQSFASSCPTSSRPEPRPFKSPASVKKDPMASLFVPKHRAYSQRPV
ncbi:hypothetical protein K443DRAFT_672292 [Laccaria amethystina LaAM-08-1]|uniref:Elongin-A n=1 Tax=Laccaria amethystina LaAM-08-1 TaxID=1095629 RepID=A0A0C9XUS9_9AGAR|nr:hypothetical protein K443DRAFT_672292 [Laccaria amethystina LaAM-08-1]